MFGMFADLQHVVTWSLMRARAAVNGREQRVSAVFFLVGFIELRSAVM